jgi:CheY-like chemotaxis protein
MRVALLCPELLFGTKIEGALRAAGHDVQRWDEPEAVRATVEKGDVLVVDLTDPDLDGASAIERLRDRGALEGVWTLGFYSHVDVATKQRAEQAGFDRVVPRSRMAREGPALVEKLASA